MNQFDFCEYLCMCGFNFFKTYYGVAQHYGEVPIASTEGNVNFNNQ